MPTEPDNYWAATKHPWACVLFVLPLLVIYEVGLYATGTEARNGADAWLRAGLNEVGIAPAYGAPVLLVSVLLAWGLLRREGRPTDKVGVWFGMIGESAGFALLLLALCQGVWHLLLRADTLLGQPNQRIAFLRMSPGMGEPEPVWGQIISFVGAGIYEETLFRLVLFTGLVRLFCWSEGRTSPLGFALAAFASGLLFAGAHHVGPNGEAFNLYVLSFRTFAGLYFAWLFHVRGFGIAVGAHAAYDVLVGLILRHE
ncbi:MAG: CPBP family intramembrane metalloprotease [Planctomycetes bacterium]|nr:CPBP family intramembrane metalloprotease [Planctomycetota bacterium]